jgi:transmembrane sensor
MLSRRRWVALAASLVLALSWGVYWAATWIQRPDQYVTGIGGLQVVQLADGSEVTLNTNTRIRAYIGRAERRIELDSGEAYFAVARDPSRRFVIDVAGRSVTDIGTHFSVRRTATDVQVLVSEGRVQLSPVSAGAASVPTVLDAGDLASTAGSETRIRRVSQSEVEQLLSWRGGFISFHDTPLTDAVAEFNRYQTHKLVIEDSSLADIQVVGRFRTNNLEGFLSLLQQGFPVIAEDSGDHISLKHRR